MLKYRIHEILRKKTLGRPVSKRIRFDPKEMVVNLRYWTDAAEGIYIVKFNVFYAQNFVALIYFRLQLRLLSLERQLLFLFLLFSAVTEIRTYEYFV